VFVGSAMANAKARDDESLERLASGCKMFRKIFLFAV